MARSRLGVDMLKTRQFFILFILNKVKTVGSCVFQLLRSLACKDFAPWDE